MTIWKSFADALLVSSPTRISNIFHQRRTTDLKRRNSLLSRHAKKPGKAEPDPTSSKELLENSYIRFSRAFQRHVVYKCTHATKDQTTSFHHDCQFDKTLESFLFLDEAMVKYPNATLDKLLDVGFAKDNEDFELILAGMGTRQSISMLTQRNGEKDSSNDSGINALHYLASIAVAGQRIQLPPPGSKQLNQMRDAFVHRLGWDISPKRFESHSPESIHRNYDRVMDLLTRGRARKVQGVQDGEITADSGSLLMQITQSGLAFSEAGARAVIADFPQLCLYDIHELEDRIRFMISPTRYRDIMKDEPQGRAKTRDVDCKFSLLNPLIMHEDANLLTL